MMQDAGGEELDYAFDAFRNVSDRE